MATVEDQLRAVLALEDPATVLGELIFILTPDEQDVVSTQKEISETSREALGELLFGRLFQMEGRREEELSGLFSSIGDWFRRAFSRFSDWTSRFREKFGIDAVGLFSGVIQKFAPNLQPLAMVGALAANPQAASNFASLAAKLVTQNPELLKNFLSNLGGLAANVPALGPAFQTIIRDVPAAILDAVQGKIADVASFIKSVGIRSFLGSTGKAAGQFLSIFDVLKGSGSDPNKVVGPGALDVGRTLAESVQGSPLSEDVQTAGTFDVAGQAFSAGAEEAFVLSASGGAGIREEERIPSLLFAVVFLAFMGLVFGTRKN